MMNDAAKPSARPTSSSMWWSANSSFTEAKRFQWWSVPSREKVGDTQILASDGHADGKPVFQGFGLAISAANDAEAIKLFNAVGKGGKVQAPLGKTFFASSFGMVADRFGVSWMIYVPV